MRKECHQNNETKCIYTRSLTWAWITFAVCQKEKKPKEKKGKEHEETSVVTLKNFDSISLHGAFLFFLLLVLVHRCLHLTHDDTNNKQHWISVITIKLNLKLYEKNERRKRSTTPHIYLFSFLFFNIIITVQ